METIDSIKSTYGPQVMSMLSKVREEVNSYELDNRFKVAELELDLIIPKVMGGIKTSIQQQLKNDVLDVLTLLYLQGHSEWSLGHLEDYVTRLIHHVPLSPITFADVEFGPMDVGKRRPNIRCPHLYLCADGKYQYDAGFKPIIQRVFWGGEKPTFMDSRFERFASQGTVIHIFNSEGKILGTLGRRNIIPDISKWSPAQQFEIECLVIAINKEDYTYVVLPEESLQLYGECYRYEIVPLRENYIILEESEVAQGIQFYLEHKNNLDAVTLTAEENAMFNELEKENHE